MKYSAIAASIYIIENLLKILCVAYSYSSAVDSMRVLYSREFIPFSHRVYCKRSDEIMTKNNIANVVALFSLLTHNDPYSRRLLLLLLLWCVLYCAML